MFIKVTVNTNPKESIIINTDHIKFIYPINCGDYHAKIRLDDCDYYNTVETFEEIESMLKKKGILCGKSKE